MSSKVRLVTNSGRLSERVKFFCSSLLSAFLVVERLRFLTIAAWSSGDTLSSKNARPLLAPRGTRDVFGGPSLPLTQVLYPQTHGESPRPPGHSSVHSSGR